MALTPYVLVIDGELPVQNVQQLVAYGKKNPGKLILGTSGAGKFPITSSGRNSRASPGSR